MIKNRNENPKFGEVYKEKITKMPGGFGMIPWDSFNCLNPIQTVVWLKICETAYKTVANNYITISEPWLNRNFADRSEWKDVINTVLDLEDMGYITCTIYKASITIRIDYDNLNLILQKVGRERGAGMRIAKLSTNILSLSNEEIGSALIQPIYQERACEALKNIIDEICE